MHSAPAMLSLLAAALAPRFVESLDWVLKKCQDQHCDKPDHPILDWDGKGCICRAHPCWSDNGVVHGCGRELPHLAFAFHANGTLVCNCARGPHIGSVYIAQDLCPGETCGDEKTPILSYDEASGKCTCTSHPCLNDNGLAHSCASPDFPVLSYTFGADGKRRCGCVKAFKAPAPANGEL